MTAQRGKDLLLKLDFSETGSFVAVAGLRARQIAFNATPVDITDAESAGNWREILDGAGARSASVTGSGIFRDATSDAHVRQLLFDAAIRPWQLVIPDFGTIEGPFHVAALTYAGQHDGQVTFDLALGSAGELTFTAL